MMSRYSSQALLCFLILLFFPPSLPADQCPEEGLQEWFIKTKDVYEIIFQVKDTQELFLLVDSVAGQVNGILGYDILNVGVYNGNNHDLCNHGSIIDNRISEICVMDHNIIARIINNYNVDIEGVAIPMIVTRNRVKEVDILINIEFLNRLEESYNKRIPKDRYMEIMEQRNNDEMHNVIALRKDMMVRKLAALIRHEMFHAVGLGHYPSGLMTPRSTWPSFVEMDLEQYKETYQQNFLFEIDKTQLNNWRCHMSGKTLRRANRKWGPAWDDLPLLGSQ